MIRTISLALALLAATATPLAAQERDRHEQAAYDLYRDIIAFRTAHGHGQVDEMVAYLKARLLEAGFAEEDILVTDYDSEGEPTQGLMVRYAGDGSAGARPIVLLGHMDVVDALPEDWELDPFTLTERDGYFYGRGTTDNKYGIANLTSTFIRLRREGWVPSRDLWLVFSGDEETTMVSTIAQAQWVAENIDPAYVLNSDAGEIGLSEDFVPLVQRVQLAEKTYVSFELEVTNQGGHSSRPRADNAIYDLARALQAVEDYRFPVRDTPLTRSYFAAMGERLPDPIGAAMRAFAEDPDDAEAIAMIRANPEFTGTLSTTCVATMLAAGHAENALPQRATATVNCRVFPGESVEDTATALATAIGNPALTITTLGDPVASPESALPDEVHAALAASLASRGAGSIPIVPYMESGGTDGMHYRRLGYDTMAIAGLASRDEDMFAHGLNERIRVDAFYSGLDHWYVILQELAGR